MYAKTIIINQQQAENIESSEDPSVPLKHGDNDYEKFCNRFNSTFMPIGGNIEDLIVEDWTEEDSTLTNVEDGDLIKLQNPQCKYKNTFLYIILLLKIFYFFLTS